MVYMKFLHILNEKLEEIILVIMMTAATVIVAAQVVTRYVFQVPLPWSEEIARYLFIWLVWLGAAFATKERRHIIIDVVVSRLPDSLRRYCFLISTAVWIVFLAAMFYLAMKLTISVYTGGQIAAGSGIRMWIPYAAVPTGMFLMLFRLIQNCVHDVKLMKGGQNPW